MIVRSILKGIAVALIVGVLIVAAVTFGPVLFRRDHVHYGWAGTIGTGRLGSPIGIAYAADRLHVTDADSNRVVVFDTTGVVVAVWDGDTLDLRRPMHISVGPDQRLYVAEYESDRVTALDLGGHVVRRVGGESGAHLGQLDAPGGAAARGDTVFVADFYNHRVEAFTPAGVAALGRPGRLLAGRLHYPTDVGTDDSLVYVADAYNNRIQVFRPNGAYVRRWGGPLGLGLPGPFKGWFRVATGIKVRKARVYVADFYNDRIQVFTDRGRYLGGATDSLRLPTDLTLGPNGELYVVDFGHRRVIRLVPTTP